MIRLNPSTSEQTLQIVPRNFPTLAAPFDNISLVVTEDGTGISESFSDLVAEVASDVSNFVTIDIAFTILKEGYGYYLEFKKGGVLWFRDKAYVTSQSNKTVKHTINTNYYEQYEDGESNDYIII
jgi:hypothetical protein